jgi:hypothetical protein
VLGYLEPILNHSPRGLSERSTESLDHWTFCHHGWRPTLQPSRSPVDERAPGVVEVACKHLPVLGQGLISMGEVINGLLREQQYLIESLEGYISGSPRVRPIAR